MTDYIFRVIYLHKVDNLKVHMPLIQPFHCNKNKFTDLKLPYLSVPSLGAAISVKSALMQHERSNQLSKDV